MGTFREVRVAAVQATPVILDAEASIAKAVMLIGEAAAGGAELVVLPETFVSLYPSNAWAAAPAAGFGGADELWERMWASSVDVPGPAVDELIAACRGQGVVCAIGVNERESARPGTLYNTLLLISGDGLLHRHRKLMPTHHERLFHGIGAGDDLQVVPTGVGRVGGLICWENRMPLARYALYRGGPQIWVAPTADDSDGWLASMRHIAIESGAFVVSAPQYIPSAAFPDDFPVALPDGKDVFGRGGAAIVDPQWGEVIAGPLYDAEGIVYADCDLRRGLHAKRWFDAVGHYSRAEVLDGAAAGAGGVGGPPAGRSERVDLAGSVPARRGSDAMTVYHAGARELQDRFDTRRLADRLEDRFFSDAVIDDADRALIEKLDMFFLATADAEGHPQCSYKGGAPGFVRVLDQQTLAFPNYDGNGMYLSAGNLRVNPHVGLLFIDFVSERPNRLRISGEASIVADGPLVRAYPGAQFVVRVDVTQVFPNCPRYIHRMALVERSRFVPDDRGNAPVPSWKRSDWACDVLPANDPANDGASDTANDGANDGASDSAKPT